MLDVASSAADIISKLLSFVTRYKKKKETQDKLVNALEYESGFYLDSFEEASVVSQEILPLFEDIKKEITLHDTHEVFNALIPLPLAKSDLIKAFVNTAKACEEISYNPAFMDDLMKYDRIVFDFIEIMKESYSRENNKAIIDGKYYRFFQIYGKAIMKDIGLKSKDFERVFDEAKPTLDKIKRFVKFVKNSKNRKVLANKETRKRLERNYKQLAIVSQQLEIKEQANDRLNSFLPKGYSSVLYLVEELNQTPLE